MEKEICSAKLNCTILQKKSQRIGFLFFLDFNYYVLDVVYFKE